MQCPYCECKESKVLDSRHIDSGDYGSIRRRRECEGCNQRFTTYERIEMAPVMVVKKDGRRELFDRDKIKYGLARSCEKRPVPVAKIEEMVEIICSEIRKMNVDEIESSKIGELLMEKLKNLDEIAYVRFASVYRQFKDINTFVNELEEILKERNKNE